MTHATEPRLIFETGTNREIANLVDGEISDLGYRLVRVRMMGADGGATLQIMAERPDGTMKVEDCEKISRAISPILDAHDPIANKYHLEVSSPGIDRVLVRASDFKRWTGCVVKVELNRLVDRRKRVRGVLTDATDTAITVITDQGQPNEEAVEVAYAHIAEAKLVFTDDLIAEAQKRQLLAQQPDNDNTNTNNPN